MDSKISFGIESIYIFGDPSNLSFSDRGIYSTDQDYYRINIITSFDLRNHFFENFREIFKNVIKTEAGLISKLPQPQKSYHTHLFNNHLSKYSPAWNQSDLDLLGQDLEYGLKDMPKGYINFLFINMPWEEMRTCSTLSDLDTRITNLLCGYLQANQMLEEQLGIEFTRH